MSNFSCLHVLAVAFSINLLFCIIAYKYSYVFLPEAHISVKMDRASKSMTLGATVDRDNKVVTNVSTSSPTSSIRTVNMDDKDFAHTSGRSHFSHHGMETQTHSKLKGYIIPYAVYEQQTAAARNLWGLQLWAKSVDMKVVEPFINEHGMSFEGLVNGTTSHLKFSELYDRDFWNSHTAERDGAPLVDWEEFLQSAPRKMILVLPHIIYGRKAARIDIIDKPRKIIGSRSCGEIYFSESAMKYFNDLGFHYVREICIMFQEDDPLTMKQFARHILGKYESSDVTVMFAFWQGVRSSRINIRGVEVTTDNTISVGLMPSKKVIKESDHYVRQFVPAGSKYFGVMVRVERALRVFSKAHGLDKTMKYMTQCANRLGKLGQFKNHRKWKRTLAIDMGRFGSKGLLNGCLRGERDCGTDKLFGLFFTSVFGSSWSIEEYEDSFTKYISNDNPAYIAQVQRTIAARSDCMVMVGGKSNFQAAAISFYKYFHSNVSEQCIIYHCFFGVDSHIDSI